MLTALHDAVPVVGLVVLLLVAYRHPAGWIEAGVALLAAAATVASGAVGRSAAGAELRELFPVVAFLCAILVVAEVCAAEGVFVSLGDRLSHRGRDPRRLLGLTFVAAMAITVSLSLDATVVLLTPVVLAAAAAAGVAARPAQFACVRLANSASLLLPVSNLTSLLAFPHLHLSFARFALVMAPVWLGVVLVEYVAHSVFFRRELAVQPGQPGQPGRSGPDGRARPLPMVPVAVVVVMLVGFAVASPLGIAPAWVASAAALVLAAPALKNRTIGPRQVAHATHVSFAIFVLGLGIVVAGLSRTFLGDLVSRLVPDTAGLAGLLAIALVATVLANLLNNLPATLILVPLIAPLGDTAVLAALIGLGVGASLTWTGSLANLLWRRALIRQGVRPSAVEFHRLGLVTVPPALLLGVLILWAWAPLVS